MTTIGQAFVGVLADGSGFPASARAVVTAGQSELNAASKSAGEASGKALAAGAASEAEPGYKDAGKKAAESFSDSAKESLHALTSSIFAGVGVVGAGELVKSFVEAGDELEGANIKIEHIFGESAESVEDWAKGLAGSFGISQSAAEALTGSFAQILTPLGKAPDLTASMSEKLVELTQDMARFNNADPAAVQSALIAGLRGRATALRQYGVDISATAVAEEAYRTGIAKQGATLTDAQKTQASYNLILEQTKNQAGAVADSSTTLKQKQAELHAEVQNLEAGFGQDLMPILAKIAGFMLDDVVPAFEATGHWISQNEEWLKPLAATIGIAVVSYLAYTKVTGLWKAATATAGSILAQFTARVDADTAANEARTAALAEGATAAEADAAATEAAAAAQAELDAAMDANPIGLVVAALAALAVGLYEAWEHSSTFRAIVLDTWHAIQDAAEVAWRDFLKPIFDAIVTGVDFVVDHWKIFAGAIAIALAPLTLVIGAIVELGMHWQDVMNALSSAWQYVWGYISGVWNSVGAPVFDFVKDHWGLVFFALTLGFSLLIQHWRDIWDFMLAAWNTVGQPIFDVISAAVQVWWEVNLAVFDLFRGAWDLLWAGLELAWDTIGEPIFGVIKTVITAAMTVVKDVFVTTWDAIKVVITTAWTLIKTIVTTYIDAVKTVISTVLDAIETTWHAIWGVIGGTVTSIWNGIKTGMSAGINGVKTAITDVLNAISTAWSNTWHAMSTVVQQVVTGLGAIVQGIWDGVTTGIHNVVAGAVAVINTVIGAINDMINVANKVPFVNIPHVHTIDFHADGGDLTRGWNIVGDEGPEAMFWDGNRATVYPNNSPQTKSLLSEQDEADLNSITDLGTASATTDNGEVVKLLREVSMKLDRLTQLDDLQHLEPLAGAAVTALSEVNGLTTAILEGMP